MTKKKLIRAISLVLCGAVGAACLPSLAGCKSKKDSIVIMTEELSGLFNPFYATAGSDMDVVGMTQIGMLSTDSNGDPVANDSLPTVVKAFSVEPKADNSSTVYTFVIKNGIKFSDGKPLTMNDVIFNMYEYLDPVYTGSSTMYSIDIQGLSNYRTQTRLSSGGDGVESQISENAYAYARLRRNELYNIYTTNAEKSPNSNTYKATPAEMERFINEWPVTSGYKNAVATLAQQEELRNQGTDKENAYYRAKLLEDYNLTLETFKEELEADFKAAKESYDVTTLPYSDWKNELANDLFKFFLYEGYITPNYAKVEGTNRDDKTKILSFNNTVLATRYSNEADAIMHVYNDKSVEYLHDVLTIFGTAGTLVTKYAADATEILIKNNMKGDGSTLEVPNITGIVSLGHTTQEHTVQIDGVTYNVARDHNADGTPVNQNENDVLQITINGVDPKAIYNFGFSVAPAHYYTADADHPNGREIDIANNKFGVEYASSSFQSKVIQSQQHVEVPVGAGPYQATNADNATNPSGAAFWSSNIVYFKANDNFMFDVKTNKIRMQVVSSSNALDALQSGAVDYVVPQFTLTNANRLDAMESKGFAQLEAWQLGYGYIGINAGKVPKIGVRKAIMAAMETSLAVQYYKTGTCEPINWPMSNVSWAYPKNGNTPKPNGHDYATWTDASDAKVKTNAIQKIRKYAAGASPADLKITFTIAGASITDHPTYEVFKQAAEILNENCGDMGWSVEVKADSQALTKLATGSLQVWAAAWGSTIDPDMYQVYHKNSNATSVYAWGYREIKAAPSTYPEEDRIIKKLSDLIDEGRSYLEQSQRKPIYEQAMGLVLDLAIELPVYQRKNLYAYNAKTVKGFPEKVNEYSSPLEKIWELELIG